MITIDTNGGIHSEIFFPPSILQSEIFAVFAAFVAINTVIYVVLAVLKILPRPHITDLLSWRNRRGETRSIHPDTVAAVDRPEVSLTSD